jgi:hypothetical protein
MKNEKTRVFQFSLMLFGIFFAAILQAKPQETVENLSKAYVVESGLRDAKDSFKFASDSEIQHKKLFTKGLTLLGPKDVDYFVDVKSGETVEVLPGEAPPKSKLVDVFYIKSGN